MLNRTGLFCFITHHASQHESRAYGGSAQDPWAVSSGIPCLLARREGKRERIDGPLSWVVMGKDIKVYRKKSFYFLELEVLL
jgi:hypothetical protein